MDRYRAAVGGNQDLDMNFNYHISILKSPIPFKLGLNISGNLDKMKFGMGKAKYKNAVTPVEIHKVDSTIVNMGEQIVRDFIATNTNHQLISIMFDKPICHIKSPYLLPEITQKYLMYGKTLQ